MDATPYSVRRMYSISLVMAIVMEAQGGETTARVPLPFYEGECKKTRFCLWFVQTVVSKPQRGFDYFNNVKPIYQHKMKTIQYLIYSIIAHTQTTKKMYEIHHYHL